MGGSSTAGLRRADNKGEGTGCNGLSFGLAGPAGDDPAKANVLEDSTEPGVIGNAAFRPCCPGDRGIASAVTRSERLPTFCALGRFNARLLLEWLCGLALRTNTTASLPLPSPGWSASAA